MIVQGRFVVLFITYSEVFEKGIDRKICKSESHLRLIIFEVLYKVQCSEGGVGINIKMMDFAVIGIVPPSSLKIIKVLYIYLSPTNRATNINKKSFTLMSTIFLMLKLQ